MAKDVAAALPDAGDVLGPDSSTDGVQELASARYDQGVQERMPRDFARMYHPNGSSSIILLPPLGKTGRSVADRRQKIMHYIMTKRAPDGSQWWYAKPPPGWEPQPLPYRCPVEECTRRGGLPNLLNLWRHIMHKHPGEVELYQGVLNAIKAKLEAGVPEDLQKLLIDGPVISEEDGQVAQAEAQETLACECGWPVPEGKNPKKSLAMHQRFRCPLREQKEG